MLRMKSLLALTIILSTTLVNSAEASTSKPGTKCEKLGSISILAGTKYTCIRLGNHMYWDNGFVLKNNIIFPKIMDLQVVSYNADGVKFGIRLDLQSQPPPKKGFLQLVLAMRNSNSYLQPLRNRVRLQWTNSMQQIVLSSGELSDYTSYKTPETYSGIRLELAFSSINNQVSKFQEFAIPKFENIDSIYQSPIQPVIPFTIPPVSNQPPGQFPGGSGPGVIIPTDPVGISARWDNQNNLIMQFDYDANSPANATMNGFAIDLYLKGSPDDQIYGVFPINKASKSQSVIVTPQIITSMFNLAFGPSQFAKACVRSQDSLNNISNWVCTSQVP